MYLNNFESELMNFFTNEYKKIVDDNFEKSYILDPGAFPIYPPNKFKMVILEAITEYSDVIRGTSSAHVYIFPTGVENYTFEHYLDKDIYSADLIHRFPKANDLMKNALLEKGIDTSESIMSFLSINYSERVSLDTLKSAIISQLVRKIQNHRASRMATLSSSNNTLSKPMYSKQFENTKYDISTIIQYFADYADQQQIDTLFEQMSFCYAHNKFLASAAVAGVMLEELCVLILRENEERFDNKNCTLIELAGLLRSKKIIERKSADMLKAAAIIRNSVSHSSTGFAGQAQTDLIVMTFKNLFDEYMIYRSKK